MTRHHVLPIPLVLVTSVLLFGGLSVAQAQNHFGVPAFNNHVQAASVQLSLDSLKKYTKQLSGILPVTLNGAPVYIPHRLSGTTEFRQAADFIHNTFDRFGLNPVLENNVSPYTKVNVIGTKQGLRNEYVVMCGHFDSKSTVCPGVDDNGSGTVAVLELARLLINYNFEYTIKFIAFGGEEQGLKGSKKYVQSHGSDSIRAVINCDMIMWDGDNDKVLQVHSKANAGQQYSSDLADYIWRLDSLYNSSVTVNKRIPGATASDHASFWNNGNSAVLFIEEYYQPRDFNPYYHTAADNWANNSTSSNLRFFDAVSRLAVISVTHLANLTHPVPVDLLAFRGTATERSVRLTWSTTQEENNAGFIIERKNPGTAGYTAVGFVPARGQKVGITDYEYHELVPHFGEYEYRLRQLDNDGTVSFSHVVYLHVRTLPAMLTLQPNYPNPFSEATSFDYYVPSESQVTVTVHDALGREVARLADGIHPHGWHQLTFRAGGLPEGMYFCIVTARDSRVTGKLILSR